MDDETGNGQALREKSGWAARLGQCSIMTPEKRTAFDVLEREFSELMATRDGLQIESRADLARRLLEMIDA
jgi:hypothetical protein